MQPQPPAALLLGPASRSSRTAPAASSVSSVPPKPTPRRGSSPTNHPSAPHSSVRPKATSLTSTCPKASSRSRSSRLVSSQGAPSALVPGPPGGGPVSCEREAHMDELMAQRVAKLDQLRELGMPPYPTRAHRTHTAEQATAIVEALPEGTDEAEGTTVTVAGR